MSSRILSKHQAWLAVAVSFTVLCLSMLLHQVADNPEGRYLNDSISLQGSVYYEFKDGRVWMVMLHDQSMGSRELSRFEIATYAGDKGKWTMASRDSDPKVLEVRLLSLRILDSKGKVEMELPRMVVICGRLIKVYTP